MKHKLNGLDRLIIPKLLPEQSTMLEQITIKEILEKIKITTDEFADFGLVEHKKDCPTCGRSGDGTLTWDEEKIKTEKEFDLNKTHTTVMKDAVDKKDKVGEIGQQILETCQRILKLR